MNNVCKMAVAAVALMAAVIFPAAANARMNEAEREMYEFYRSSARECAIMVQGFGDPAKVCAYQIGLMQEYADKIARADEERAKFEALSPEEKEQVRARNRIRAHEYQRKLDAETAKVLEDDRRNKLRAEQEEERRVAEEEREREDRPIRRTICEKNEEDRINSIPIDKKYPPAYSAHAAAIINCMNRESPL
jgi:hypothetical protein